MATIEELETLLKVDEKAILARAVGMGLSEYDVVKDALIGMRTIRISERVIELPGMKRQEDLIIKTVAHYRKKWDINLMPLAWVKSDQIAVESLRPQVFGVNTYVQSVSAAGTVNLVPVGAAGTWSAVKDEEVVIITDFVELKPDNIITGIKVVDIDGEPLNPEDVLRQIKISDIQACELSFPLVCDLTLDIDGYAEAAGDTELVPCGVHIALGRQIPALSV